MNTEVVDRPEVADEVVDAAPAGALALANLRRDALAELTAFEAGMAKLQAEHGSTDYDITTAFGLKLATTRRHAIRLVRYAVPKVVKAKRAELTEIVKTIGTEGERIEALLQALEDKHDVLIKAEETRKAAIAAEAARVAAEKKAEADRLDAERKAKHEAGIEKIRAFLRRCDEPGMTAARIDKGIGALQAQEIGEAWEEYRQPALDAQRETIQAMVIMHAVAVEREEAAEAAEAKRIENERIAAELAEQKAKIEAEAEELRQRVQAFEAQQAEANRILSERMQAEEAQRAAVAGGWPHAGAESVPVGEVIEHQELEAERIADLEAGAPKPGDDEPPVDAYLPVTPPAVTPPAAPTLRIGVISERLGFTVTATLLSLVGVEPAGTEKRAILYRDTDWPRICDGLIHHITTAKEQK